MVLVIGALIAIGFVLMVKSHRHEPSPQPVPLEPITRLIPCAPSCTLVVSWSQSA
jgi:hypothetical protein